MDAGDSKRLEMVQGYMIIKLNAFISGRLMAFYIFLKCLELQFVIFCFAAV